MLACVARLDIMNVALEQLYVLLSGIGTDIATATFGHIECKAIGGDSLVLVIVDVVVDKLDGWNLELTRMTGYSEEVIDDGSFETASGFAASDSRVTVARTEKARSGPGVARNLGLDLCHGRWIKFMDADDLISFNAIASLVNASRKMKGRNVLPVLRHQTVECVRPFDLPLFTPLGSPGNLDVRVPWNVHGLLFDHSVVGPLRFEDLKFGEDSLFVVDYLDRLGWTGSGGFLPTSQCYFYRKSPKSLTRDNPEKAANARKTVEAIDANPRSGYCDVLRSRVERVRRVSAARASGR